MQQKTFVRWVSRKVINAIKAIFDGFYVKWPIHSSDVCSMGFTLSNRCNRRSFKWVSHQVANTKKYFFSICFTSSSQCNTRLLFNWFQAEYPMQQNTFVWWVFTSSSQCNKNNFWSMGWTSSRQNNKRLLFDGFLRRVANATKTTFVQWVSRQVGKTIKDFCSMGFYVE